MKLITRYTLAAEVAERWGRQYSTPQWRDHKSKQIIHRRLLELGPNPNPDEVDRIIGNTSWTRVPKCCECGREELDRVIQMGEELSCESSTAWICVNCLVDALRLVDN